MFVRYLSESRSDTHRAPAILYFSFLPLAFFERLAGDAGDSRREDPFGAAARRGRVLRVGTVMLVTFFRDSPTICKSASCPDYHQLEEELFLDAIRWLS